MTNLKTISSLVGFYTTELQNKIRTNLTLTLGDSGSVSGNSDVSKKQRHSSLCDTSTPWLLSRVEVLSDLEGECLEYIKSDVQTIVCEVLGVDKTYLYMQSDKELDSSIIKQIDKKITRYKSGEPLAYILGYKYFWDQKLKVTQDTLIPRADTEVLVQVVLDDIEKGDSRSGSGMTSIGKELPRLATQSTPSHGEEESLVLRILDLGTGTGAIALALAGELPNAKVVAVDYSTEALGVAKENATSNGISNVEFVQSDWYKNLDGRKFDIIVSNPPYIDSGDNDTDAEVKAYEPSSALFAKDNGLADIEIIISQAKGFLIENGGLYIEHGYTQSASVQEIFKKYGFVGIETIQDLNGKDRCTRAIKKSSNKER